MYVSQYINDPARAETRICYIIHREPSDKNKSPCVLSFFRVNYRTYNSTSGKNNRLYANMLDATIIDAAELDGVQIDSAKVVFLLTR